ncbi:microcystin degradation protein MlrC [Candidatus Entotheonella serta]|nr:microcystin degradation protein MlrC [Candidatus Entotheonella serta]
MRIGVAMMSHETNTFSPVITDLERFSGGRGIPLEGQEAINVYSGTMSCLGGYLKVCSERGAEVVMSIAAGSPPSGPVEDDAFEWMCNKILETAANVDAMLLDLHGAMVTRSYEDGEGELLKRLRAQNPDLPIAVALDMHGNITEDMVANSTVITGYHTYPHVDMASTAERSANIFFDYLAGGTKPVMRWGNAPMLPHIMRQGTDDSPNKEFQDRAEAMEAAGALGVSVFTGFPHADINDAGLSVVVVTDGDADLAEQCTNELLDQAWEARDAFVYEVEPLEASIDRAKRIAETGEGEGPVVILDHYDNTASGGTMDTTEVLAAVLDAGLEDVAVFGFYDPDVVNQMEQAGVGSTITMQLGGKLPMPALAEQSQPIELTGRVKLLSEGKFKAQVPMARGLIMNMGKAGVLSVGGIDIVVLSRHIEPYDPECLRSLGIEPMSRRYVMLKSRIHYRVGYRDLAKAIVECAGRGVCTSDYSEVDFRNVRRPIFPLDNIDAPREAWGS